MADRQIERWRDARKAQHEAREVYAEAVRALSVADAELIVAGAALAERAAISGVAPTAVMPLPFGGKGSPA